MYSVITDAAKYQYTALAASGETTIVSAQAGFRRALAGLLITTAGAAAATLTLRDGTGGTTVAVINYPNAAVAPGTPFVWVPPQPIAPQAVNTNWTIQNSVTTATNITALFYEQD
jgi:hypothetical protein